MPAAALTDRRCRTCPAALAPGYTSDLCRRCLTGVPKAATATRPLLPSTRAARKRIVAARLAIPLPPAGRGWTLEELGEPPIAFAVHGEPAPQGSKDPLGAGKDGKMRMRESSRKVGPWRKAVQDAAGLALPLGWVPLDGPLIASMVFTMRPPARIPAEYQGEPVVPPDDDKLLRSTGDALKTAGVLQDDARIIDYYRARKLYPRPISDDPEALDQPGAVIRVWRKP